MDEKRAALLLGTLERRTRPAEVEIRADGSGDFTVRGYASVVEHPYEVYGGPDRGGWIETIARDAFNVTLAAKPDVAFLINHDGIPLARTRSGTLALSADNTGLASEASIDGTSPLGQTLRSAMERKDLDQMSFGFRVTRQEWNEDYTERRITEVSLDHGDVSIVTYPANPATSMNIVSARSAVDFLRSTELAEIRADVTPDELREAHVRLGELVSGLPQHAEVASDEDGTDAEGRDEAPSAGTVTVDVEPNLVGWEQQMTLLRELIERVEAAVATPKPNTIEITDGEGETVARVEEDGTASFADLPGEEPEARRGVSLAMALAIAQLDT